MARYAARLTACLVASFGLTTTAHAAGWTPPQVVAHLDTRTDGDSPPDPGPGDPVIARTPDGALFAAWRRGLNSLDLAIRRPGERWRVVRTIQPAVERPRLFVAPRGRVSVVWHAGDGSVRESVAEPGETFGEPRTVYTGVEPLGGTGSEIVSLADGTWILAYLSPEDRSLRAVVRPAGGAFGPERILSTVPGGFRLAATGAHAVVSYVTRTESELRLVARRYDPTRAEFGDASQVRVVSAEGEQTDEPMYPRYRELVIGELVLDRRGVATQLWTEALMQGGFFPGPYALSAEFKAAVAEPSWSEPQTLWQAQGGGSNRWGIYLHCAAADSAGNAVVLFFVQAGSQEPPDVLRARRGASATRFEEPVAERRISECVLTPVSRERVLLPRAGASGVAVSTSRAGGAFSRFVSVADPPRVREAGDYAGTQVPLIDLGGGSLQALWGRYGAESGTSTVETAVYDAERPRIPSASVPRRLAVGVRGRFRARVEDSLSRATARWVFGDGRSRRGTRVAHRYRRPGRYRVKLTAVDQGGNRRVRRFTVRVRDR